MEHLTEILTYLLQRQENGEFSAEKEEIDRAERAILLEQIGLLQNRHSPAILFFYYRGILRKRQLKMF